MQKSECHTAEWRDRMGGTITNPCILCPSCDFENWAHGGKKGNKDEFLYNAILVLLDTYHCQRDTNKAAKYMLCSASIVSCVVSTYLSITSSNGSFCFQMSSYTLFIFCLSSDVLTLLHIFRYILYLNIWFRHWFRYLAQSHVKCFKRLSWN